MNVQQLQEILSKRNPADIIRLEYSPEKNLYITEDIIAARIQDGEVILLGDS